VRFLNPQVFNPGDGLGSPTAVETLTAVSCHAVLCRRPGSRSDRAGLVLAPWWDWAASSNRVLWQRVRGCEEVCGPAGWRVGWGAGCKEVVEKRRRAPHGLLMESHGWQALLPACTLLCVFAEELACRLGPGVVCCAARWCAGAYAQQ
jgi:hypothetical protein